MDSSGRRFSETKALLFATALVALALWLPPPPGVDSRGTPLQGDLRLVDGSNAFEGRLEIFNAGQWGTVCDDGFTDTEAGVACRQLGLVGGEAKCCSLLGAGNASAPIWLDNVTCMPDTARLEDCSHNGFGNHDCDHGEDVGVVCVDQTTTTTTLFPPDQGELRLQGGGDPMEGRLEIFHEGQWGTVCDDLFDRKDATVACRQLGHVRGSARCCEFFDRAPSQRPIWLAYLRCDGTENSLDACPHNGFGIHTCDHFEDAGVVCSNDPSSTTSTSTSTSMRAATTTSTSTTATMPPSGSEGELRLIDGTASAGRLEIFHEGRWGSVCDDGFRRREAGVACRELGFAGGSASCCASFGRGRRRQTIWLDQVDCTGTESQLTDCDRQPFGEHNCVHDEDVGIECTETTTTTASSTTLSSTTSTTNTSTTTLSVEPPLRAPNDSSVLMLADSLAGDPSLEERKAANLGLTLIVASSEQWARLSVDDFRTYRALVIGDPNCTSQVPPVLDRTADRWGAAVDGNAIIIGTDPEFHATQGGGALTERGIAFAVADEQRTGAYVTLSCWYDAEPTDRKMRAVRMLDGFGTFTVRGVGCYDRAHIVADHPALDGLVDGTLARWGCSVHEAFDQWPPEFQVLAIARDIGASFTAPDGSSGSPYILARGAGLTTLGLSLTPSMEEKSLRSQHTVVARLVDDTDTPVPGQLLGFTVESGPNAGVAGFCDPANCQTDADGEVAYTYQDAAGPGVDVIRGFVDADASGMVDPGEQSVTAIATWVNACADGVIAGMEQCESPFDACCDAGTCMFRASGSVCRPGSGDLCDPDEQCSGSSDACPGDTVTDAGTVCSSTGRDCDPDEFCTGVPGEACPPDLLSPKGTVCRVGSGDLCDPDETCSGVDEDCMDDRVEPATTECRPAVGDCDVAESCSGVGGETCPDDGFVAADATCADDDNPCTDDLCDGAGTCLHPDNTAPCDDGSVCTQTDVCSGGVCTGSNPILCDDGDICTDDSCDSSDGCINADNTAACDDGDACTTADACAAGTCTGGPARVCDDGDPCTEDSCNPASGCEVGDPIPTCGTSCGDPNDSGRITSSDSLVVLRAAIGARPCQLQACDADGNCRITATDALIVLRKAVGQPIELACPTDPATQCAR